jgi:hypothetical protein
VKPISASGFVLTIFGSYLVLYRLLIARTRRGQDPERNVLAAFNIRVAPKLAQIGPALVVTGLVLLVLGRFV